MPRGVAADVARADQQAVARDLGVVGVVAQGAHEQGRHAEEAGHGRKDRCGRSAAANGLIAARRATSRRRTASPSRTATHQPPAQEHPAMRRIDTTTVLLDGPRGSRRADRPGPGRRPGRGSPPARPAGPRRRRRGPPRRGRRLRRRRPTRRASRGRWRGSSGEVDGGWLVATNNVDAAGGQQAAGGSCASARTRHVVRRCVRDLDPSRPSSSRADGSALREDQRSVARRVRSDGRRTSHDVATVDRDPRPEGPGRTNTELRRRRRGGPGAPALALAGPAGVEPRPRGSNGPFGAARRLTGAGQAPSTHGLLSDVRQGPLSTAAARRLARLSHAAGRELWSRARTATGSPPSPPTATPDC